MKLGAKGALLLTGHEIEHVKGYKVKVVDTTAAGDAFTAALAVALSEEMELPRAVRFANAAGAKTCEKFGAQPALPTRIEVESLLEGMH
jgi:ribokinase